MADETEKQIAATDLDLIDPALADNGVGEDEMWAEMEAAEAGKQAPPQAVSEEPAGNPTEQEPGDVPAPQDKQQAEDQPSDIWTSAPPELKQQFEEMRTAREKAEQAARSNAGRIAAYQRQVEELRRPQQKQQVQADSDVRAALDKMKQEYPELADPLAKVIGSLEQKVEGLTAAEQRRLQAAQYAQAAQIETETSRLAATHPDWLDVLNRRAPDGASFAEWIEDQPKRVRDAAYRNANAIVDASEAAELVAAYKQHLGAAPAGQQQTPPQNDRRQRQLAATASPQKSKSRPVISGIPDDGDPQAIWDAMEAQEQASA